MTKPVTVTPTPEGVKANLLDSVKEVDRDLAISVVAQEEVDRELEISAVAQRRVRWAGEEQDGSLVEEIGILSANSTRFQDRSLVEEIDEQRPLIIEPRVQENAEITHSLGMKILIGFAIFLGTITVVPIALYGLYKLGIYLMRSEDAPVVAEKREAEPEFVASYTGMVTKNPLINEKLTHFQQSYMGQRCSSRLDFHEFFSTNAGKFNPFGKRELSRLRLKAELVSEIEVDAGSQTVQKNIGKGFMPEYVDVEAQFVNIIATYRLSRPFPSNEVVSDVQIVQRISLIGNQFHYRRQVLPT